MSQLNQEHDSFYHYKDKNYTCSKCNISKVRFPDGSLRLQNPNIEKMKADVLYHLAFSTESHDLVDMFSDVKFVCMGGTSARMETFAYYIQKELNFPPKELQDLTAKSQRFSMYKVGPVLSVSHGMGLSSIGICLNEIIKLMHHSKAKDPIFFRIGTCGGLGIQPGTVAVATGAVDEMANPYYEQRICGKIVRRKAVLDQDIAKELLELASPEDNFKVVGGVTMAAEDFYEGQGRTDGAFCHHSEEDKMNYLKTLHSKGVVNIEMEATVFSAFTYEAGIKSAIVNVALVNRLNGDQVTTPKDEMIKWQNHPQIIVGRYIKKHLK